MVIPTFARDLFVDIDWRSVHEQSELVHLRLKERFLPCSDDPDAELYERGRSISVSKMSDEDFKDYLNRLSMLAGMNGIEFPERMPPEEGSDEADRQEPEEM